MNKRSNILIHTFAWSYLATIVVFSVFGILNIYHHFTLINIHGINLFLFIAASLVVFGLIGSFVFYIISKVKIRKRKHNETK